MFIRSATIAALAIATSAATADRIDMVVFENASGGDVSGLDLWVDIVDQGTHADIVFHNSSSVASFISAIYIESTDFSDAAFDNARVRNPQPAGVKFVEGASPPNPAGSIKHYGGNWQGNLFAAKADSPGSNKDGIDQGEHAVFQFDYDQYTYQQILDALAGESTDFRIAQHVQGIGPNGFSVWTMNGPSTQVIPLPSAAGLSLAGLALAGVRRRR